MKIYRKKKILLIFILMFTFSCRDTRPIYREFSPPLENRELNINIQSDKEIEKILRAQWYFKPEFSYLEYCDALLEF